jgi:hypothetical protein
VTLNAVSYQTITNIVSHQNTKNTKMITKMVKMITKKCRKMPYLNTNANVDAHTIIHLVYLDIKNKKKIIKKVSKEVAVDK